MRVRLLGWLVLLALAVALLLVADESRPSVAVFAVAALVLAFRQGWIGRGRRRRRFWRRPSPRARRPIPVATRRAVLARDGHACLYCGRRRSAAVSLQLDHLYPYSLGGTDDAENLVAACAPCNLAKGVTVFRSERDLARFARRRQAWAAEIARRNRSFLSRWWLPLAALLATAALLLLR